MKHRSDSSKSILKLKRAKSKLKTLPTTGERFSNEIQNKITTKLVKFTNEKKLLLGRSKCRDALTLVRLHFKSAALLAMRALAYGRRLLLHNNFLAELPSLVDA